jgi:dihydroneopterin aldolase/D-erythro-7,8-dihydroneopterin triphosphate epimerase
MTDATSRLPQDEIRICDLKFRCIVGVNEDERHRKQDIVAQIVLYTDLRPAGRTDALEDTVDYKILKKEILALAERSHFLLIEALAESIADICLRHDRVEQVAVTIEKPGALRYARTVAVKVVRNRQDRDT